MTDMTGIEEDIIQLLRESRERAKQRQMRSIPFPAAPEFRLYEVAFDKDDEVVSCTELPLIGWLYDPVGGEMVPLTPNGEKEYVEANDEFGETELVVVALSRSALIPGDCYFATLEAGLESARTRHRKRLAEIWKEIGLNR
jgi:hypothetical protein